MFTQFPQNISTQNNFTDSEYQFFNILIVFSLMKSVVGQYLVGKNGAAKWCIENTFTLSLGNIHQNWFFFSPLYQSTIVFGVIYKKTKYYTIIYCVFYEMGLIQKGIFWEYTVHIIPLFWWLTTTDTLRSGNHRIRLCRQTAKKM